VHGECYISAARPVLQKGRWRCKDFIFVAISIEQVLPCTFDSSTTPYTMRFPPAEIRAQWPKPNYVDPVTRGSGLLIVELTLVPVALLCVILRLWIRIGWLHRSWWDDWLMFVAMVSCAVRWQSADADRNQIFSCLTTALVIMATQMYGWNIHVWDATIALLQNGRKVRNCRVSILRPPD